MLVWLICLRVCVQWMMQASALLALGASLAGTGAQRTHPGLVHRWHQAAPFLHMSCKTLCVLNPSQRPRDTHAGHAVEEGSTGNAGRHTLQCGQKKKRAPIRDWNTTARLILCMPHLHALADSHGRAGDTPHAVPQSVQTHAAHIQFLWRAATVAGGADACSACKAAEARCALCSWQAVAVGAGKRGRNRSPGVSCAAQARRHVRARHCACTQGRVAGAQRPAVRQMTRLCHATQMRTDSLSP